MTYWQRHPRKELQDLLIEADKHGWRIERKKKYYRIKCPCGSCQESVHLTPSDPNYGKNKLNKMSHCERW